MLKRNKSEMYDIVISATHNAIKPHEAIGWPPGLEQYIRNVAEQVGIAIVNEIYTEEELDARVDEILLIDRT